jgi:hypothetical protein
MWVLVILLVAALILLTRKKARENYNPTDEQLIQKIVDAAAPKGLAPINTISRDGNSARMMFLDTDTYAGQLSDAKADPYSVAFTFTNSKKIPFKM